MATANVGPSEGELMEMLEKTIATVPDLSQDDLNWVTDPHNFCSLRYLKANNWKLQSAIENVLETIRWRNEYHPAEIEFTDVFEQAQQGNIYTNGKDKDGRPIIVLKCRGVLDSVEKVLKLYIYTFEKAIKRIPKGSGIYQIVLLFDMEGMSYQNTPPIEVQRQVIQLLMRHYPERVQMAYFSHQPWIFSIFYNMIYPFMEQRHKDKVCLLGWDDFDDLHENVELEELEEKYGGCSGYEFDPCQLLTQN